VERRLEDHRQELPRIKRPSGTKDDENRAIHDDQAAQKQQVVVEVPATQLDEGPRDDIDSVLASAAQNSELVEQEQRKDQDRTAQSIEPCAEVLHQSEVTHERVRVGCTTSRVQPSTKRAKKRRAKASAFSTGRTSWCRLSCLRPSCRPSS